MKIGCGKERKTVAENVTLRQQKRGRDGTDSKDSDRKHSKDIKVSDRKKIKTSNEVMHLTSAGEEEQEDQEEQEDIDDLTVQTHHLNKKLKKGTRIRCQGLVGAISENWNGMSGTITEVVADDSALMYHVILDNGFPRSFLAENLEVVKVHEPPKNNAFDDVAAKPAMPQASEGGRDSTPVLPRTDKEKLSALVDEMMEKHPLTWKPKYFDAFDPDKAKLNN